MLLEARRAVRLRFSMPAISTSRDQRFKFSIGPSGHGSFSLYFHLKTPDVDAITLIGQWQTAEQAQNMATRIESRLFHGANVQPSVPSDTIGERLAAE
jgi:hypothetical protein